MNFRLIHHDKAANFSLFEVTFVYKSELRHAVSSLLTAECWFECFTNARTLRVVDHGKRELMRRYGGS